MAERLPLDRALRIAAGVAAHYRRKLLWADRNHDDVHQAAALAVLQARATFDPARGVREETYLLAAAMQGARREVYAGRLGGLGGAMHRPKEVDAAVRLVPDASAPQDTGSCPTTKLDLHAQATGNGPPTPEHELAEHQWDHLVRERLAHVGTKAAVGILLHDLPALDRRDRRHAAALEQAVFCDDVLYALFREKTAP